jgi:hypothetical protein
MNQALIIQELAIAIAAQQLNPSILNPDFLKYSGVVPADWELARQPARTNTGIQLIYQNGVTIVAQPNQMIFAEPIAMKENQDVEVAAIAQKCVRALPQIKYGGVGINLRGHIPFSQQESQTARDYLFNTLLAPGSWQEFGEAPVQAALRFNYTLSSGRLDLDIAEVKVKLSEEEAIPAVLFTGLFSHALATADTTTSLEVMTDTIQAWQGDLETFKMIVNQRFLQSMDAVQKSLAIEPALSAA